VLKTDVCIHADAGIFLGRLLACGDGVRRAPDNFLIGRIRELKAESSRELCSVPAGKCGVDPLALVAALRRGLPADALLFSDVTASEHLAAEYYQVDMPRTYFNPVDNQAMGWSIPAAIGAQKVNHGRTVATLTGDGCALMSGLEISTAARDGLPVKFFILDDHAYHYMQMLQKPAYLRTTATILARMDYAALARALGVGYVEVLAQAELDAKIHDAVSYPGPVLVRVATDYGNRKIRWIEAVRKRYTKDLTAAQKAHFLARIGSRAIHHDTQSD
jgi:acetolactate synthase I/II/III large subunit